MKNFILSISCRGQKGIIATVSNYLAENNCNILDCSQFDDLETGHFFMRIHFQDERSRGISVLQKNFAGIRQKFAMQAVFRNKKERMKILVMASKFNHCLYDLLYRQQMGALPVSIVGIVANHDIYGDVAARYNIPFHYIPVSKENKLQAEKKLQAVIKKSRAELIVLARYMQILSENLCKTMSGKIINIHHSFLPGFKGANPYKQAYQRGVKLIGATAHYVTADLDEGPIIEQDTIRVSHAQNVEDLTVIGRDIETQVLARAVLAHSQHRTFIDGRRVIVFPAEAGSFAGG